MLTVAGILASVALATALIRYYRREMAHARAVLDDARKRFAA